jgi:RimJ/RimL family protein N-acetyltransferase
MMADSRLSRYLAWAPHGDSQATRAVLQAMEAAQQQDMAYHWTVFMGASACGLVSLIDVRRQHRQWELQRAEIAYWVGPAFQGQGIATEAVAAVVGAAFGPIGLNRLIVSHTSENVASGQVPRKLGFRFVGCERQFFRKDGQWFDMNHYELLRDDWRASSGR